MTNEAAFTIAPGLLPWLGSAGPGATGPLSPFLAGDVRSPTLDEMDRLRSTGVIGADGALETQVRSAIAMLGDPVASVAVRLSSGEEYYEHTGFFPRDGGGMVLFTTAGTDILVRNPAPVEEIVEGVRQYVGDSVLRAPRFEAELDPEEAIALAAVIDLHRRALFRAYAEDTTFARPILGPAKIAAAIENSADGLQWLVGVVKLLGGANRLVPAAIDRLVRAGHLRKEKGGFALADEAALLAERLLVVESVLALEAVRAGPGTTLHRLNLLCLQAGIHDILGIEAVSGRLRFECLSGAAVVATLHHLLTEPGALAVGGPAASTACPSCGEPAPANTKFCRKCGAPLPPP